MQAPPELQVKSRLEHWPKKKEKRLGRDALAMLGGLDMYAVGKHVQDHHRAPQERFVIFSGWGARLAHESPHNCLQ